MVGLFQWIQLEKMRGETSRSVRISSPQLRLGPLQKQRLRSRGQVAALYGEPRFECWARGESHPFEQFAGGGINFFRLRKTNGSKTPQIDLGAWLECQIHRITAQSVWLPKRVPQLSETPSQCTQRIVGFGEEQIGKLPATRGPAA
jgi:hypothetical protein